MTGFDRAHGTSGGLAFVFASLLPSNGTILGPGELLVDPNTLILMVSAPHAGGVFAADIFLNPTDSSLCGMPASFQGLCTGGGFAQLSNALDIRIGL